MRSDAKKGRVIFRAARKFTRPLFRWSCSGHSRRRPDPDRPARRVRRGCQAGAGPQPVHAGAAVAVAEAEAGRQQAKAFDAAGHRGGRQHPHQRHRS